MRATATMLPDIYHAFANLDKRERRKRLVALLGGQAAIARAAEVDRATVCKVVRGWAGGPTAARVEGLIQENLAKISEDLVAIWVAGSVETAVANAAPLLRSGAWTERRNVAEP